MKVNGLGVLFGIQEAAKQMIAQGSGGKIINTNSQAGKTAWPDYTGYCASKFVVSSLTQSGARALAKHHITVNSFATGARPHPIWDVLESDALAAGQIQQKGEMVREFEKESCSDGVRSLRSSEVSPATWLRTTPIGSPGRRSWSTVGWSFFRHWSARRQGGGLQPTDRQRVPGSRVNELGG